MYVSNVPYQHHQRGSWPSPGGLGLLGRIEAPAQAEAPRFLLLLRRLSGVCISALLRRLWGAACALDPALETSLRTLSWYPCAKD